MVASGDRRLIAIDPDRGQVLWSTDITRTSLGVVPLARGLRRDAARLLRQPFGRISVFDLTDGAAIPDEGLGPVNGPVGTIDVAMTERR